tara:strand:+ start:776 stop:1528 length:753 start_codon:yes stop_codon:yes gene_type:complete
MKYYTPKPLSLKERTEIIMDDAKYIEHVQKWLHYIAPNEELKKKRVGKGRRHFDYLTGQDVIRMLNDIFLRGWEQEIVQSDVRTATRHDGRFEAVAVVRMRFTAPMPSPMCDLRQENFGDKDAVGRTEVDAIKDLEKSAITDALKRCVKNLALRLGLFLYYEEEEWKNDVASAPADASPSTSFASHKDLQGPWATMVLGVGKDTATQLWPRLLQAKSFTKTTVPTTFLPELNRLCSLPTADELIAAIAQL